MVRINLIQPKSLADQHLIAEYDEILMLIGYVKKYPENKDIPDSYRLGKGHIKFFKNKLKYLKKRHELIKKEMKRRNFAANKTIKLDNFSKELQNDWRPGLKNYQEIKARIVSKIKNKPKYYRYCKNYKSEAFLINLIKNSK